MASNNGLPPQGGAGGGGSAPSNDNDERRRLLDQVNGNNPQYNATAMPQPLFHHYPQGYYPGGPNHAPSIQQDPQISEAATHKSQPYGMASMVPGQQMLTKSYSVHADGALGYLTPLQLGRHE